MEPREFAHMKFSADTWEDKLKKYIDSLDYSGGVIWHRKRENKKIHEELATLGYYVKYKYASDESVQFVLNQSEGKADGWIFQDGKTVESVQIAIAHYEHEDALIDARMMNGEDVILSGWVMDAINLMSDRVIDRAQKKAGMEYKEIDTLLIGARGWFARRLNTEHQSFKSSFVDRVTLFIRATNFNQLVVVDTDFVGRGELLIVPNQALQPTSGCDAAFFG